MSGFRLLQCGLAWGLRSGCVIRPQEFVRSFCRSSYMATKDLYATEPSAAGFNDYEAERRNFNLVVPEYYNFASDVIDVWAAKEKVLNFNFDALYPLMLD